MVDLYLKIFLKKIEASESFNKIVRKSIKHCEVQVKGLIKRGKIWMNLRKKVKNEEKKEEKNSVTRFDQKNYMFDFGEKVKENKEFAEKLMIEQKARKLRQIKRNEKIMRKLEEKNKEQERLREEAEWQKERNKQERVDLMMEKRKEREQYLKDMKDVVENEYRKIVSSTPLYKKLEISYFSNVEMPELENRKEELKKKREKFKPVDYEQLKEHARSIDNKRSEFYNSRILQSDRNCIKKSKLIKKVIQEEMDKKSEQQRIFSLKKQMASKKKKYSEVVKVVHSPEIDPLKQKQMALIKAKLTPPIITRKLNWGNNDNFLLNSKQAPQSKSPIMLNTKDPILKNYKPHSSHPLFSQVTILE